MNRAERRKAAKITRPRSRKFACPNCSRSIELSLEFLGLFTCRCGQPINIGPHGLGKKRKQ